jgi:glucokinase
VDQVLAVDVGGTKVAAGVVDRSGRLLRSAQVPTAGADADALFEVLVGVVHEALDGTDPGALAGCGVGSGGPMAAGGEAVSPLNIPQWRDFPLRMRLAERLGTAVWVDNDAKALALGEGWRGAAQGVRDYLAMVVSTGVGGGIVLDGRLLHGHAGNAGHIGHLIVEPGGRRCGCGAVGCLEAEASGTAIRAVTGAHPEDAPAAVRQRTGTLVGRAVASVANLLDLRLACVAGSVALGYGAPFFEAAQAELDRSARIGHARGARIVPGGLGADGPLVGAGAVAWRGLGHDVGVR